MIKEALQLLFDKAAAQAELKKPEIVRLPEFPNQVFVQQDGKLDLDSGYAADNPARTLVVRSFRDFIRAIELYKEQLAPAVYINAGELKAIIDDDGYRRDTVTLPLARTEAFMFVCRIDSAKETAYEQVDFLRLLRNELRFAPGAAQLAGVVQKLRFIENGETNMEATSERDTLGIQRQQVVEANGPIPLSIAVPCRLYSLPDVDFQATFDLELILDKTKKKFVLKTLIDQVANEVTTSLLDLRGQVEQALGGDKGRIFLGECR